MSEWNDAIEAAATIMDRWARLCDRTDYDETLRAGQFEHNAEAIRSLKRQEQKPTQAGTSGGNISKNLSPPEP